MSLLSQFTFCSTTRPIYDQSLRLVFLLNFVHFCTIFTVVNGAEFIRMVRRIARRRGEPVRYVAHRGKGSHGTLCVGARRTIVKDRKKEIGKGLLASVLSDLAIDPDER